MEIKITKSNFEKEVIKSEVPVLLDFYATWCGPCRMLSPIISEIAQEKGGKLKIGKIDVDEEPGIAADFGVESIPTLVVVRDGVVVNGAIGYLPKEEVLALVDF